jgi:2-oxoglutarate dehydrogenase E1 component
MSKKFSFASGANAAYLESVYEQYLVDPSQVDDTWRTFFEGYEFASQGAIGSSLSDQQAHESAKVEAFIHAYRRIGHLSAHLSPLESAPGIARDLSAKFHGLEGVDDQKVFHPVNFVHSEAMTFKEIRETLEKTYCRTIGADFRDINDIEIVKWFQVKMETCDNKPKVSLDEKKRILGSLAQAEGFERFLQARYLGQKRFSLEGCDAMIPMLDTLVHSAAKESVEEICIGMAHRGRLNVLVNTMGKPVEKMLKEFEGSEFNPFDIDGDVKYHMGFANELAIDGKKVRMVLLPNPSHLEAVNPVVEGFVKSRMRQVGQNPMVVMPVLLHGDASFIGQGLVAETLNFSMLESYSTGGTIHIIINNQIGFTTNPKDSRSCDYSSDIAKLVRAPVLHVNADDAEACVWVMQLAVEYRQKFGKDIVIDLVGYRRHGHNETDEPGFTQPLMYRKIAETPTVLKKYVDQLVAEKSMSQSDADQVSDQVRNDLQAAFEKIRAEKNSSPTLKLPSSLRSILEYRKVPRAEVMKSVSTGVDRKQLLEIGRKMVTIPDSFQLHPKIKRIFTTREQMLEGDGAVDWGFAELLAFATLAKEGHHVRLSGQDCKRGTFSSRHAVLFDFETGDAYEILNHIGEGAAPVQVINSPLSEQGCLGFEFGYSVADPNALVLWEAQFGDFANGAQIIIDQFLVASEAKWKQTSSLVLMLPHGYEGMGPEHSSGRLERFLQLCGNTNIQVCNATTPAQLFHLLRRQVKRNFHKPLVIMTPKSLLRHSQVISSIKDFTDDYFREILEDCSVIIDEQVDTVVLCSGKIYYEILDRRDSRSIENIPIVRIEQIYPFPYERLSLLLKKYASLKSIVWAQEEPENMGAWSFVRSRIESIVGPAVTVKYVGRRTSGTTAEGTTKAHLAEQQRIIDEALGIACGWMPKMIASEG